MPLIRRPSPPPATASVDATSSLVALTDGTDDERWAAARAVSDLPGGLHALSKALVDEPNSRVREAIFTGLARHSTTESVELILPFMRSDDAQIRTGALDALRSMKGAVQPHLPQLLHDRDVDIRLLACELVRNLPSDEATRYLCELLSSELDANVCASAVDVLAEVGGQEALPVLALCAERFRGTSFLEFSIKITADRIRSQSSQ